MTDDNKLFSETDNELDNELDNQPESIAENISESNLENDSETAIEIIPESTAETTKETTKENNAQKKPTASKSVLNKWHWMVILVGLLLFTYIKPLRPMVLIYIVLVLLFLYWVYKGHKGKNSIAIIMQIFLASFFYAPLGAWKEGNMVLDQFQVSVYTILTGIFVLNAIILLIAKIRYIMAKRKAKM